MKTSNNVISKNSRYIRIGEVSKLVGVSTSTLRRWDVDEYLTSNYPTKGEHRRYRYKKIL
ncbi:MAG: MerR family transcriptional regulator [Candidatus Heimdallarchaeota archaeon]|nr:MerR family transcriptional regulator [Candidatus Heimdallarchaeota archaeon]